MRSILRSVLLATGLLLLTFMTASARLRASPNESIEDQWNEYDAAVKDAATYKKGNLHPLRPLSFDESTMTATVVTLTDFDYPIGVQAVPREVWVTVVPEVKDRCIDFRGPDLELRLKQLLGLWPGKKIKHFVTMRVKAGDIFRPTANPITTTGCLCGGRIVNSKDGVYCEPDPDHKVDNSCVENFPAWVHDDYKAWIANQMLSSYKVSPPPHDDTGAPWTRLGYTYDWNEKAGPQHYGASEYVIRPGAFVNVTDKVPYANYCAGE